MESLRKGNFEHNNTIFQVRQPIEEVINILEFKSKNKQIEITTNYANLKDTMPICCDKQRIMQVTLNLLSNAVKFTPLKGKIHIKIRHIRGKGVKAVKKGLLHPQLTACHGSSNMLEVSVWDNGVGIHQNNMNRLFEHDGFI